MFTALWDIVHNMARTNYKSYTGFKDVTTLHFLKQFIEV